MPRKINEEQTRKEMIDPSTGSGQRPQLEHAGWYLRDHSKVKIESFRSFGFFTREDLENLLYIRQNAKPFSSIKINNKIVDCSYQHEAIRRVGEAFANGKRKALIVMVFVFITYLVHPTGH